VTSSELAKEVFSIVEKKVISDRASMEFEMAYQMRVAGEKIRFAIKAIDEIRVGPTSAQETSLQLLDALNRLEETERRLQSRQDLRLSVSKRFTTATISIHYGYRKVENFRSEWRSRSASVLRGESFPKEEQVKVYESRCPKANSARVGTLKWGLLDVPIGRR